MDSNPSTAAQPPKESDISNDFSKEELAQSAAALLDELASSLEASRKAILAGDLKSLQQATREQVSLKRALHVLWTPPAGTSGAGHQLADPRLISTSNSRDSHRLRSAQQRVLYLGRVVAALLARRRRWLRTLAHITAGPGAIYSRPAAQVSSPRAAVKAGQEPSCQA